MAYVANDPYQQNQQGGSPAIQPPVTTSSAPGSGTTGGQSAQPNNQSSGQPFTNLSAYLSANQPQIEQMATGIASDLGNQYGQIQGNVQSGVQGFNEQVSQGYTPYNAELIEQATDDPRQFVQTPENVAAFQKQLNNQYTGPGSFEQTSQYGDINQKVNEATNTANLLKSPGGFQSYLHQRGGRNTTAGQDLLDSVLLQGSPQAIQMINQAASPFEGLTSYLSDQTAQANQGAQAAQTAAQQSSTEARNKLTGAEEGFGANLQNKLGAAKSGYEHQVSQLENLIATLSKPLDQVAGSYWGTAIDPRLQGAIGGMQTYNTWNPAEAAPLPLASNYLSSTNAPTAPTLPDIATADDAALGQALAMLSGGSYTSPVSQAGNYQPFQQPTINSEKLSGGLYDLVANLHPTFTGAIDPGGALTGYNSALAKLRDYLGIVLPGDPPPADNPPPPPPPPPPTGEGGGSGPGIIRPGFI